MAASRSSESNNRATSSLGFAARLARRVACFFFTHGSPPRHTHTCPVSVREWDGRNPTIPHPPNHTMPSPPPSPPLLRPATLLLGRALLLVRHAARRGCLGRRRW